MSKTGRTDLGSRRLWGTHQPQIAGHNSWRVLLEHVQRDIIQLPIFIRYVLRKK